MARFRPADSDGFEVTLSWTLVVLLAVGVVVNLSDGNLLWAGLDAAVVAVALVPPALTRDRSVVVAWEALAVAAVPVLARLANVFAQPATYLSVAALGLIVAVEIDAFSSAEMPPWFARWFVILTTMAVAGVWGVLQYYSDALLGTSFLAGRPELMWELVIATAVGVAAGVAFQLFFRERDSAQQEVAEGRSG